VQSVHDELVERKRPYLLELVGFHYERVIRRTGNDAGTAGDPVRNRAQLGSNNASAGRLGPALAHQAPMFAVAFNLHGLTVACACGDGIARQWDIATGRPDVRSQLAERLAPQNRQEERVGR
jgi:hypothetical protein